MVNHTSIQSGFFPCRSDWRFINQGPRCTYIFCYFGIRQTVKEHIVYSRWPPWRFSALTPPSPSLSTIDRNQKPSLAALPWKFVTTNKISTYFSPGLASSKGKQYSVWGMTLCFCCFSLTRFQLWNRTQPNSKNVDFFPIQLTIVKIILFRNCMLRQSFTINYFLIWP